MYVLSICLALLPVPILLLQGTLSHYLTDRICSFKALALGADFVQLGRPILWGLAHQGEEGVRHVLKSLLAEFEITVGLAGCASLKDVDQGSLTRNSWLRM
jgi:hypothetical protein